MKKIKLLISKIKNWFKFKSESTDKVKLIESFEKDFKVDYNLVLSIFKNKKLFNDENKIDRQTYLTDKLIEGGKKRNEISKFMNKVPFFYEPEIIEIHNENKKPHSLTLNEFVSFDYTKAENDLKKQERELSKQSLVNHSTYVEDKYDTIIRNENIDDANANLAEIRKLMRDKENKLFEELQRDLDMFKSRDMFREL